MHNLAKPIKEATKELYYTSKNSSDIDFIFENIQRNTFLTGIIEEKKNPKVYELKKETFFINNGMRKEITQTNQIEEILFNMGFECCSAKLK